MATTVVPSMALLQHQTKATDEYRRDLMIHYAFSAYSYVITPKEADKILYEGYWEDVDAFCEYMQNVNFGVGIPGTTNVVLPSTLRIYTDEDLDLMNAGLYVENRADTDSESLSSAVGAILDGDIDIESDAWGVEPEPELPGQNDDDEPLPLYTPESPPGYVFPDFDLLREIELTFLVSEVGDVGTAEARLEDEPRESTAFSKLGAQLGQKISKAKRKLARGLEAISPKSVLQRARKIREVLWVKVSKAVSRDREVVRV
ncbi:hypothetical protein BJ170DRAFT_712143 [Xylariales sp. AK1849]|nr:hypothetical protein BJ170DRAFT_712143 [Xylariales sp. AK1849]